MQDVVHHLRVEVQPSRRNRRGANAGGTHALRVALGLEVAGDRGQAISAAEGLRGASSSAVLLRLASPSG